LTEVRKGLAAIREAAERKGTGGDFTPFCPEIKWRDNDEEKYILILTDLEDLQEFAIHEWIKVGDQTTKSGEVKPKYEWFISRKDPSIGEKYDDLQDRLGQKPTMRFMGVAVEVIPVTEKGRGGKTEIVGFEVATTSYTAKGEDDEEVEVDQPEIGVISLSSANFWGWLGSFQEKHGNVNEIVFSVTRRGKDANTTYDFVHMKGTPVDLSGLLDTLDGCSYLSQDEKYDEFIGEAGEAADAAIALDEDGDLASAMVIADVLLQKRISELSDAERYRGLVAPIEELPAKWGRKKGASTAKSGASTSRARRTGGRSSSRTKTPDAVTADAAPTEVDTPSEEAKSDKGFNRLRERARKNAEAATTDSPES
jgi:hypothetical protein